MAPTGRTKVSNRTHKTRTNTHCAGRWPPAAVASAGPVVYAAVPAELAPVHDCRAWWRATPPPTGRHPCAMVAHGCARHRRPTCTNWSRRWPPQCTHVAHGATHGVLRGGCTRAGGSAPPVRWLRGGDATAVF
ncbi:hypothetical protein F511_16335 [Dorcoceras hygrometricum]|uniref:Uncharacterized protein n=1 Tax=Dorcoceras hygrometricum TaxID=472368 RepID=A0A2Z7BXU3_9LAMI|nr:hypothetical protein F511_16335 [Dorcoceras hygrometricum]